MIDVGIVGLDTSHPEAFAEKLHRMEVANVKAVWDGGDVRTEDYAESFSEQFGATLYDDPHNLIDVVDAAMILTVNWDTHADLAIPFLETDVPTFIDKPLAGCLRDVRRIAESTGNTPIFGGSSVPYHPSLGDFPTAESDRTLYCAGYNDPFYYGVHLVNTVRRFVGADWTSAAPASGPGTVADIEFENGTRATIRFDGSQEDSAYAILDVSDQTRTIRIDGNADAHEKMYDRFIDAFLEVVRGDRDESDRLVDGARLLLAIHAAFESDQVVTPESEKLRNFHADGEAFLADYAPYY